MTTPDQAARLLNVSRSITRTAVSKKKVSSTRMPKKKKVRKRKRR